MPPAWKHRSWPCTHRSGPWYRLQTVPGLRGAQHFEEALPCARRAEKGLTAALGKDHEETRFARILLHQLDLEVAGRKK